MCYFIDPDRGCAGMLTRAVSGTLRSALLDLLLQLCHGGKPCINGLVRLVLDRDPASSVAVAPSRDDRIVRVVGARTT